MRVVIHYSVFYDGIWRGTGFQGEASLVGRMNPQKAYKERTEREKETTNKRNRGEKKKGKQKSHSA